MLQNPIFVETEAKAVKITPEPWFVVKSRNLDSSTMASGKQKVFVNVCHSNLCPAPIPASDEQICEAMNGIDNGYRIPVSL